MEISVVVAKATASFFSALRTNSLAAVAVAVISLLGYLLFLSAGVVVNASTNFVHFSLLAVFVSVISFAVLIVVAKHKTPIKQKQL